MSAVETGEPNIEPPSEVAEQEKTTLQSNEPQVQI